MCVRSQSSRRPNFKELNSDMLRYQRWLLNNSSKAFYTPVVAEDLRQGTQYLLQVCVYSPKICSVIVYGVLLTG